MGFLDKVYGVFGLSREFQIHKNIKTTKNRQLLDGSEKSLVDVLKESHSAFSVALPDMTFLEEFSAGTGIADLVFVQAQSGWLENRVQKNVAAITSVKELELLSIFSGSPSVSEDEILKRIGRSNSYTTKLIKSLLKKNAIISTKNGFTTNLSFEEDYGFAKTLAIEAKVKDWKSGLKQALRYQEFADYSYLAIYETHSRVCVSRARMFKELGIGLVTVSDNGVVSEMVKPHKNLHYDRIKHFLASERFFSVVDETQEAFVVRNFLTS